MKHILSLLAIVLLFGLSACQAPLPKAVTFVPYTPESFSPILPPLGKENLSEFLRERQADTSFSTMEDAFIIGEYEQQQIAKTGLFERKGNSLLVTLKTGEIIDLDSIFPSAEGQFQLVWKYDSPNMGVFEVMNPSFQCYLLNLNSGNSISLPSVPYVNYVSPYMIHLEEKRLQLYSLEKEGFQLIHEQISDHESYETIHWLNGREFMLVTSSLVKLSPEEYEESSKDLPNGMVSLGTKIEYSFSKGTIVPEQSPKQEE